jgi:hypothetical protein
MYIHIDIDIYRMGGLHDVESAMEQGVCISIYSYIYIYIYMYVCL